MLCLAATARFAAALTETTDAAGLLGEGVAAVTAEPLARGDAALGACTDCGSVGELAESVVPGERLALAASLLTPSLIETDSGSAKLLLEGAIAGVVVDGAYRADGGAPEASVDEAPIPAIVAAATASGSAGLAA